jgi:hypothetical protein
MYKSVAMMSLPEPTKTIWRFMDLSKLISLLEFKSLYFSSILRLNDPFEAYTPFPCLSDYKLYKAYEPWFGEIEADKVEEAYNYHFGMMKELRKTIFVNCWHVNEYCNVSPEVAQVVS